MWNLNSCVLRNVIIQDKEPLKTFCFQGMTVVYLITYIFGYEMWKFTLPIVNLTAAESFELLCYGLSSSFFSLAALQSVSCTVDKQWASFKLFWA